MLPGLAQVSILLPLLFSATAAIAISIHLVHRRLERVFTITLVGILLSGAGLTFLYLLETVAVALESKLIFDTLQYPMRGLVVSFALCFALVYTGRTGSVKAAALTLGVIYLMTSALLIWNPGLLYGNARLVPTQSQYSMLTYSYTALAGAIIAYDLLILGLACLLMVIQAARSGKRLRIQAIVIAIAFLIPGVAGGLFAFEVFETVIRDVFPYTFSVTLILIAIGILFFDLLDVRPVAFTQVFSQLALPLILLDRDDRIIGVNEAALALFNTRRRALAGQIITAYQQVFPGMLSPGKFPVQTITTNNCVFELTVTPIGSTHPSEWLLKVFDITDRARAEEEVRRGQEAYRALAENSPDMIARFGTDLKSLYANNRLLTFFGETEAKLGTKDLHKNSFANASTKGLIKKVNETREPLRLETTFPTIDPERIFDVYVAPEFDEANNIQSILAVARDVTGTRKMSQTLADSERRYRSIIEQSAEGITMYDGNGTVIEWNRAMELFTGRAAEEMLGHKVWDAYYEIAAEASSDERDYQQIKSVAQQFLANPNFPKDGMQFDYLIRQTSGATRWVTNFLYKISLYDSEVFVNVVQDISETKRIQEELALEKAKLHSLINNTLIYMWSVDDQYRLITANEAMYRRFEKMHDRPVRPGDDIFERIADRYKEHNFELKKALDEAFAGKATSVTVKRTDGNETYYLRQHIAPIRHLDGSITGATVISRNVTQEIQYQQAKEAQQAELQALLNNTEDIIILLDSQKNVVTCNDSANRFSKHTFGKALEYGTALPETWFEARQPETMFDRVMQGDAIQMDIERNFDGNLRLYDVRIAPIRRGDGQVIGMTQFERDVTEQRSAQQERLERLMISRYLADLVHDITSPLSSLKTSLFLLASDPHNDQAPRWEKARNEGVERISTLIDVMRTVSEVFDPSMEIEFASGDLNQLIKRTLLMLKPLIDDGEHIVTFTPDPELQPLTYDHENLKRVILGVLQNALQHSTVGLPIDVSTQQEGTGAIIRIRDYGQGIAEKDLPHVFEAFFRAEKHRPADGRLGLGLTTAKKIVEAHNGTIRIGSTINEGTTVTISIPGTRQGLYAEPEEDIASSR